MTEIAAHLPILSDEPPTLRMSDCTHAFAVPGEDSMIDVIRPGTSPERSWIRNETIEEIRLRYPRAEVISIDDYCAAKAARQDTDITWTEVTGERYWDMLEVLPPAIQNAKGFMVGEPTDHHAGTGRARYAAFLDKGGKFFESSRPLTIAEFRAL